MPLTNRMTVIWAALFAAVHAYWAAGGEVGMNGEPADTAGAQIYIAFIALLGLTGGAVAAGLAAQPNHRTLLLLARAGGAALLLGVVVGTARWVGDGGLNGDGAQGIAITLYFLLGGVLFSRLSGPAAVPQRRPHA
jgi:hypothetical protein